jgi:hypothetical protein
MDGRRSRTAAKANAATSEPPRRPPPGLVDAYRTTDFVIEADLPITLHVDRAVPAFEHWLTAIGCRSVVVITAFNPFSQVLSPEENTRRNSELFADIRASGLAHAPAYGQARDGNWPSEPSFGVFDAPAELILRWMQKYCQYAVVVGTRSEGCGLLWHPLLREQPTRWETNP